MKNRSLYLKILVICLMAFTTLFCITACQKEAYEVKLDKTQITLSAGTFEQLTATVDKEGAVIEWSSSAENVATVTANGKVYGVDVGTATITAKYDKVSASCLVVVEPSEIPIYITTKLNGIIDTEYNLYSGNKATLEIKLYDGTEEQTSTFNVQSLNTDVVSVENGELTAKAAGSATIEFSTTYKGESYKSSIVVNVVKTLYITMPKNFIDLSAASEGGDYAHTYDLAAKVYEDQNQLVQNAQITYEIDDPSVISVENGVITALKKGKAKITLTYTDGYGFSVSTHAEIAVHLTDKQFAETILLSKYDFTDKFTIGSEYVEGEVVYCQTTDELGETKSSDKAEFAFTEYGTGKYKVIIETTTANYTGEMILADLVIKTKEQLKNWPYYIRPTTWAKNQAVEYDGYVVLGADIDYGGSEYYNELIAASVANVTENFVSVKADSSEAKLGGVDGFIATESGYLPKFVGTFDGLGHCISNVKIAKSGVGIFGTYCAGTVKNLAITSVNLAYYRTGAIAFEFTGTAENLFLEGIQTYGKATSGLLSAVIKGSSRVPDLINIVSVLSEDNGRGDSGALIGSVANFDTSSLKVRNLFAISNVKMLACGDKDLSTSVVNSLRAKTLQEFKSANKSVEDFKKNAIWNTTVSALPIMQSAIGKLTKINLQATNSTDEVVSKVSAGSSVNIGIAKYNAGEDYVNNQAAFTNIGVSSINGVSYANGVLSVASTVAKGTQITLTATNLLDGATSTLTITVQ